MRQKKSTTFYCFSPPVMVATFLIEIVAAIFVLYRYKANKASRLVVALLLCLSAFQLAEYYVCTNSSQAVMAARLGFVAITLLPVLGLHLMYTLTNNTTYKNYTRFIYGLALFISVYFLMAPQVFDSYQCTGNYVIFQIGNNLAMYYGLYYFGLLAQSILTGVYYLRSEDSNINKLAVKPVYIQFAFRFKSVLNIFSFRFSIPTWLKTLSLNPAFQMVLNQHPSDFKTTKPEA